MSGRSFVGAIGRSPAAPIVPPDDEFAEGPGDLPVAPTKTNC
jgi:hypothetical protein